MQVLDHGIQVETLEFFRIIKLLVHGIGQRGVLVKQLQIQLIRPPVRIRRSPGCCVSAAHYWAFGFGGYLWLRITGAGHPGEYLLIFRHKFPFRL